MPNRSIREHYWEIENLQNKSSTELIDIIKEYQKEFEQLEVKELGERIKELNCLYGISKIMENPGITIDEMIKETLNLIPAGWQYPEITCASVELEGKQHFSANFRESKWKLSSDILIKGEKVGKIQVFYFFKAPLADIGPFLEEEVVLLNAIAESLGRNIQRLNYQEQLQNSINEKEILLKEIHHRVKNNLQVILAMISLQILNLSDEKSILLLKEIQNRINSMALIHQSLFQDEKGGIVNLEGYLKELTKILFRTYNIDPNRIQLRIQIENIFLDLNEAINCGLIINELVSNALKHAFTDSDTGVIEVKLQKTLKNIIILTVRDSGKGFPSNYDWNSSETLGIKLVKILAKKLKGKLDLNNDRGTCFTIKFPIKTK